MKRSEAISGIVKSISVIPNPILRSTYLSDLASRLSLKEQTLLDTMNDFIRKEKDANQQSQQQHLSQEPPNQSQPAVEGVQPVAPQDTPDLSAPASLSPQGSGGGPHLTASPIETQLIREVIRHGDEVIYDNVETDDGQTVSLTVAQYLDYDFGQDGLLFSLPIYNKVLEEAVSHSGEPGFKAESFFTNHADIEISNLASRLAVDRYQLGGRFVMQPRENSLRQRVIHLVMDYRLDIMSSKLKEIQQAIRQANNDMELVMRLMQEYKETQELRDALARRLGSDVVA